MEAEAVDDGRTGILVDRPERLSQALREIGRINPAECRREAQARFSADRMTGAYLELYGRLARGESPSPSREPSEA